MAKATKSPPTRPKSKARKPKPPKITQKKAANSVVFDQGLLKDVSAIVIKYDYEGTVIHPVRLVEKVEFIYDGSAAARMMVDVILGAVEKARTSKIQRLENRNRRKAHEHELSNGKMTHIEVEFSIVDGEYRVLNAAHRISGVAELERCEEEGWVGAISVVVSAGGQNDIERLACSFDSNISARSPADIAGIVFNQYDFPPQAIVKVNSAMVHLLNGSDHNLTETEPHFSRGSLLHSTENFINLRDNHMDVVEWVFKELKPTLKSKTWNRHCKNYILAAIIASWKIYGDSVLKTWMKYFTMLRVCDHEQPMLTLRNFMDNVSESSILEGNTQKDYTGEVRELLIYRMAAWAFLASTRRHGFDGMSKMWQNGVHYSISKGIIKS